MKQGEVLPCVVELCDKVSQRLSVFASEDL